MTSLSRFDLAPLFVSQAVPMASAVLLALGTAGLLGPTGRGEFALVTATANLLGQIFSLSLFVGAANAYHHGDTHAIGSLLRWSIVLALVVATPGLTAIISALLNGEPIAVTACTTISLLSALVLMQIYLTRTIQGIGRSRAFSALSSMQAVASLALGPPPAPIRGSPGPVLGAWAVSQVGTCIAAGAILRRNLGARSDRVLSAAKVSIAAHVGSMGQQLLLRADIPVLGLFVSPEALAPYSLAAPVANIVFALAETASLSLFGKRDASGGRTEHTDRRRRLVRTYLAMATSVGIAATLVVAIVVPRVMPEYSDMVLFTALLMPGAVVQGYARIGVTSLAVKSAKRKSVSVGISSAALSLLYVPAIYYAGVVGAAIASSILYFAQSGIVRLVLRSGGSG